MVLAKQLDQRRHDERDARFSGDFSMKIVPKDGEGKAINIRPIDVSRRGLGFLVREPLKMGGFFTLVIGEQAFRVEIAYCNNHLGIDNLFRCGLFLREADGNLHEACERLGLLSDGHRSFH